MRLFESQDRRHDRAKLAALGRSLAVIEFSPEGTILSANENFCRSLGYAESEIVGRHHRIFVAQDEANAPEYAQFWRKLAEGKFDQGMYLRYRKDGAPIYIEATYNPILGPDNKVKSVLKVAADVTQVTQKSKETTAKLAAISNVQGVIEFTPEGIVLDANDNFFTAMGYTRENVVGKHHRMFVDPIYANSPAYEDFWKELRSGASVVGSFHRFGANNQLVWLQAAYCPIRDIGGRVVKVIKFAYDISDLMRLGEGLAALSRGDLDCRQTKPFAPTFDKLRIDFNEAVDNLKQVIETASEATASVKSACDEIAMGVTDLSQRTESQAAALEQSAASIAQGAKTVTKTAQNAQLTNEVVGVAKAQAQKSGEIVGRAVEAMGRIERSSSEIGAIIGVIDEIAFQTNLLALNAGVEAARAGEAGRGFAVVASEVRALAQRSADAAKQIKTLIAASGADVKDGVSLVRGTGEALGAIVAKVAEIDKLVADIVDMTQDQQRSLAEVNVAVGSMDQATQQNAAMAEQSNAAVQAMRAQVGALSASMAKFSISAGGEPNQREDHRAPRTRRRAA